MTKKESLAVMLLSFGLLLINLPVGWAGELAVSNTVASATVTVAGWVYEDDGSGGTPADHRQGVAGVIVSDGDQVTKTDAQGRYILPDVNPTNSAFVVNPTNGGFVFVVTPSGYRNVGSYFQSIPCTNGAVRRDFALRAAPETAQPDFAFFHMTDTHIWNEEGVQQILANMKQAKALNAAFVVITGDMTFDGGRAAIVTLFGEAVHRAPLPVVEVVGNHDSDPLHRIAEQMGPDFYAFDYGGRHFVILDSNIFYSERQNAWLQKDLALQPPKKEVIVFQHHPPSAGLMQILSRYNARALFHGHWHTSRAAQYGNLLCVSAPSAAKGRFSVLDLSPNQGRLITFRNGAIELDDVFTGLGTRTAWTASLKRPEPETNAVATAPGQDWPMLLHDPARSGITADIVKPPLKLAWRRTLDGPLLLSSPVVANGVVYIGVADEENRGRAGIYALDAATGAVKWRYATSTSIKHTVSAVNGLVFGATVDGMIFAVDATNGQLKWKHNLGNPQDRWLFASPLVSENVVYGGVAPMFVALDALSGKLLWTAKSMGLDWITCLASPVAGDGRVFVNFNKGDGTYMGLYALDAKTGASTWTGTNFGYMHSTPTFANHTVIAVGKEQLFAMAADTGAIKWQFPISGSTVSSPVLAGQIVIIGNVDGKIYGLDAKTGAKRWVYEKTRPANYWYAPPHGPGQPIILGSPAVSGKIAYLGAVDGHFMALDTEAGTELWSSELGAPIAASAAISGNAVYVPTYDGTIYAFTSNQ